MTLTFKEGRGRDGTKKKINKSNRVFYLVCFRQNLTRGIRVSFIMYWTSRIYVHICIYIYTYIYTYLFICICMYE